MYQNKFGNNSYGNNSFGKKRFQKEEEKSNSSWSKYSNKESKFKADPEVDAKVSALKLQIGSAVFTMIKMGFRDGYTLLENSQVDPMFSAVLDVTIPKFEELKTLRAPCIQYCKKPGTLGLEWEAATTRVVFRRNFSPQYIDATENVTVNGYEELLRYTTNVITYLDTKKENDDLKLEIDNFQQLLMKAATKKLGAPQDKTIVAISNPSEQAILDAIKESGIARHMSEKISSQQTMVGVHQMIEMNDVEEKSDLYEDIKRDVAALEAEQAPAAVEMIEAKQPKKE